VADLEVSVLNDAQHLAAQVVELNADEDVYWKTVRLHSLFTDHLIESATACGLFAITAEMTDIWELHPERREAAAALMREAARDLLSTDDEGLDAYVVRWKDRLGLPEPRASGRRRRMPGWFRDHSSTLAPATTRWPELHKK